MQITEYRGTDGTVEKFSKSQRIALQKTGHWNGRVVVTSYEGSPSHTDADIADLIGDSPLVTSVRRKVSRIDTHPFVAADPRRDGTDTACESFTSALDAALDYGCRIVLVKSTDMHGAFYDFAAARGITLLVV